MRDQLPDQIPALRRYARMLTEDAWAADDLIQDTLERACRKWNLWTADSNLRAWLFTLMHNQHASQLRHRARQPLAAARVDIADIENEWITERTDTDRYLDLQNCLQRLPPEQRQVLLLVTVENLSYQDTAGALGIPVGTVMSRLNRARNRLYELMEGHGSAPNPGKTTEQRHRLRS